MTDKHYAPGLLNEPPMLVYPSLAVVLGINKAVVFQQLHFLLNGQKTARNRYNLVDGHWWVYNSYPEWRADFFPWLSERTLKSIFNELEDEEQVVISRQGVKHKSDRRKWYTIDYDAWGNFWLTNGQIMSDEPTGKKGLMVGQKTSDDSSETSSESTESSTEDSAQGAGSVSKVRERNPIFDAVATGHNITDAKAEGGRIAMIANWLAGTYEGKGARKVGFISAAASVEHIQQFFSDWKRDNKDVNPPMDFVKFVEQWRKWASHKKAAATSGSYFPSLGSKTIGG